jgi:hypothetical protein
LQLQRRRAADGTAVDGTAVDGIVQRGTVRLGTVRLGMADSFHTIGSRFFIAIVS